MEIEAKIAALLAEAEPLRCLDEDDEAKRPLAGIVDQINALRAQQTAPVAIQEVEEGSDAPESVQSEATAQPRRGRPRKVS